MSSDFAGELSTELRATRVDHDCYAQRLNFLRGELLPEALSDSSHSSIIRNSSSLDNIAEDCGIGSLRRRLTFAETCITLVTPPPFLGFSRSLLSTQYRVLRTYLYMVLKHTLDIDLGTTVYIP
jgi:hypothetical protein